MLLKVLNVFLCTFLKYRNRPKAPRQSMGAFIFHNFIKLGYELG